MMALSHMPFYPYDSRRMSLGYLAAGLRYTTHRTGRGACLSPWCRLLVVGHARDYKKTARGPTSDAAQAVSCCD
jgi:hypothetical protein